MLQLFPLQLSHGDRYRLWFLLLGNQMVTQQESNEQVQAAKTWNKPTAQA